MKYMTDQEIKILWEEFHVPRNIQKHMEKVAEIAVRIGKKLIDRKIYVDLKLLRQAGLVHDLAKIIACFDNLNSFEDSVKVCDLEVWNKLKERYDGMTDPEITALVLNQYNESKLADIVRKHHFTSVIEPGNEPKTWEEKVLYYADKLVMHDKEVSLKQRLRDLDKRYSVSGNVPDNIKEAKKRAAQIEKEIEEKLHQAV